MAHEQTPQSPRPDFSKLDIDPRLSLPDVLYFAEVLGAGSLPKMEGGTKKTSGSEIANLDARIAYLQNNLGIDLFTYPKPRLMADVMIDLITLCQVTTHELQPREISLELLDTFNLLMRFRHAKGQLMDTTLQSGKTLRQAGLDWNYSPGRSDNPLKPGAYKSILELLESALLAKSAPIQIADTIV